MSGRGIKWDEQKTNNDFVKYTLCNPVIIKLGREWCHDLDELEVPQMIDKNDDKDDAIEYTDTSVQHGEKSGCGFSVRIKKKITAQSL